MSTERTLDRELKSVQDEILRLASLVNEAMMRAIEAFSTANTELAQAVVDDDDEIDNVHHSLEKNIARIIALRAPVARDLSRLVAALLITNELERMADYVEGIAVNILRQRGDPGPDNPVLIRRMQEKVSTMISEIMEAYREENIERARESSSHNEELDALYKQFFNQLVDSMGEGKLASLQGFYQLWVAQYLERIGSRVITIGERIIYARMGEVGAIRRGRQRQIESSVPPSNGN